MKKHITANTVASLAFIALDPLLTLCGNFADMYSLGAEMVLGMLIPLVLISFVLFAIISVSVSLYKAIIMKDIKQTIPILVLVAFATIYVIFSTKDSLWIRVVEFYK